MSGKKFQFIVRRGGVLEPVDADDSPWIPGDMVEVSVTKPRNQAHHRKFWALVTFLAQNFDEDKDHMADICKLCAGHYTKVYFNNGDFRPVTKSIAFSAMDQVEFNKFYKRCIDGLVQKFLPNAWGTAEDLERCADKVLKGWGG